MKKAVLEFLRRDEGASAVEYGLIAGLIAAVIITAVSGIGTQLLAKFNAILVALGGTAS